MSEREIPVEEPEGGQARAEGVSDDVEAVATEVSGEAAGANADDEEVREEIDGLRDRLLRLQAEFDNFRKREARERAAAWGRAKADLSQKLLAAIDDLQRFASLDPAETDTATVVEGVRMVERKILETLEREGLSRVGEVGEAFDPNVHEAIAVLPASSSEEDGTVANVVSRGYRFGDQLLRPARVQVYEHRPQGEPGGEGR